MDFSASARPPLLRPAGRPCIEAIGCGLDRTREMALARTPLATPIPSEMMMSRTAYSLPTDPPSSLQNRANNLLNFLIFKFAKKLKLLFIIAQVRSKAALGIFLCRFLISN